MPLGIYMDNLNDWEDIGEKVGFDTEKEVIYDNYSPDFKNRHTMQQWNLGSVTATIDKWVGETLTSTTSHEIYIHNTTGADAQITFSENYKILDVVENGNTISLKPNGTAHFYGTGAPTPNSTNVVLILREGSQADR